MHSSTIYNLSGQQAASARPDRSGLGKLGVFIVGLATVLVAFWTVSVEPERPDGSDAKIFLEWYYRSAPFWPEQTWARTTPEWQQQQEHRSNPKSAYVDWWYEEIASAEASRIGQSEIAGMWRARVTYTRIDTGRTSEDLLDFELRCPWWTRLPGVDCTSNNVMLNDVQHASG